MRDILLWWAFVIFLAGALTCLIAWADAAADDRERRDDEQLGRLDEWDRPRS